TWRVVGFVVAICVVVGGAIGCLGWDARSAYFVKISPGHITIFQGRPGGVLWFQPPLASRTSYTTSSVLAYNLPALQAGELEPSLSQAQLYVQRLVSEKKEAEGVTPPSARGAPHSRPSTTTTPTTAAPPTTAPHSRKK